MPASATCLSTPHCAAPTGVSSLHQGSSCLIHGATPMQPLLYLLICLLVTTCAATCCMRNRVHSCSCTLAAARSAASNSITVLCAPCRQKVLEWLGQLGALDLAEDHEVTLPQLAPHQWQQLHSNSPMLMKPKLDRSVQTWGPRGCC